jgi:hypothetical protein
VLTLTDILHAIIIPAVVAAVIAALGRWRRWKWLSPAAAGTGFLTGYFLLVGVPSIPPQDGTDWLFWAAVGATLIGVIDALTSWKWGWIFGAAAGGVALLIAKPLVPAAVPFATLVLATVSFAAFGIAVCGAVQFAEPRVGSWACVGALCIVTGGAGVIVLSSNLRIVGIYGLAASAALGPIAVFFADRCGGARSVGIVATALLAGLLTGGHFYPDPGVSWTHVILLMALPMLLPLVAITPMRRSWIRGALAILIIGIITGAVAAPVALKAKKAAEEDPYAQPG